MLKLLAAIVGSIFLLTEPCVALDVYVSPKGDDGHDGSLGAPFQTMARARDAVRGLIPAMTGDIHVWMADGTYELAAPLTFESRDGGTKNGSVVYAAMPGAHPVISGGKRITGWTVHDAAKNIWSAPVGDLATRQLYVNGKRAVRARSEGNPIPGAKQTDTGYIFTGTCDLASWKNPSSLEFVYNFLHGGMPGGAQWVEPRIGVESVVVKGGKTTITMKKAAYAAEMTLGGGMSKLNQVGLPSYVENAYELLKKPGDWYLDRTAGQIYYIPKADENLADAWVVAPGLETLVSGSGTMDSPLMNLQFKGIVFEFNTWVRPSGEQGYPEVQAGNFPGDSYVPGAVVFQHAKNLRFEKCVFYHLGSAGLELSHGVQDTTVTKCIFEDISGSGLLQGTMTDPMRTEVRLREDGNAITGCWFSDTGAEYHGAPALLCGYVSHTLIAHNEIHHVPYTGISIGWGWGAKSYAESNRVLNNKVEDFLEQMGDGGAFYALSPQPNSELAGNWFRNQGTNLYGGAIYPDEGSDGWNIHDNVLDNVYRWLYVWIGTIKNIRVDNNFTTTDVVVNKGTGITPTNTTLIKGPWPPAAQKIMYDAGVEPK
jgi:hypothetical protein